MKRISYFLSLLLLITFTTYPLETYASEDTTQTVAKKKKSKKNQNRGPYPKNPYVDDQVWSALEPYFLPTNHPIRGALDDLFSTRVTLNEASLKKAGFKDPHQRIFTKTVVTRHSKIKGYVLKLYTDDTPGIIDWYEHMQRITGAQRVRDAIKRLGYESLFVVPKKFIYPLPPEPSPSLGLERKNFILVAEDMNILNKKKNRAKYRTKMTKKQLDAMYKIIQAEGLDDSVIPANLCFTKKGKLAFVDTGVHGRWPIRYQMTMQSLSPEMQTHWKNLFEKK